MGCPSGHPPFINIMTVILNTYFVEKDVADKVENLFLFSFDFPWFIRAGKSTSENPITGEEYDDYYAPVLTNVPDIEESGQLVHTFVQNGKQNSNLMLNIEGVLQASVQQMDDPEIYAKLKEIAYHQFKATQALADGISGGSPMYTKYLSESSFGKIFEARYKDLLPEVRKQQNIKIALLI